MLLSFTNVFDVGELLLGETTKVSLCEFSKVSEFLASFVNVVLEVLMDVDVDVFVIVGVFVRFTVVVVEFECCDPGEECLSMEMLAKCIEYDDASVLKLDSSCILGCSSGDDEELHSVVVVVVLELAHVAGVEERRTFACDNCITAAEISSNLEEISLAFKSESLTPT